MDQSVNSSRSGLENTVQMDGINGDKDITILSNTSSSEGRSQNVSLDDSQESDNTPKPEIGLQSLVEQNCLHPSQTPCYKEIQPCKSSKDEKQRFNEEIVILESSSLSSEAGSWESVFPPKTNDKESCNLFINNERLHNVVEEKVPDTMTQKNKACFIDAASLLDDEETSQVNQLSFNTVTSEDQTKPDVFLGHISSPLIENKVKVETKSLKSEVPLNATLDHSKGIASVSNRQTDLSEDDDSYTVKKKTKCPYHAEHLAMRNRRGRIFEDHVENEAERAITEARKGRGFMGDIFSSDRFIKKLFYLNNDDDDPPFSINSFTPYNSMMTCHKSDYVTPPYHISPLPRLDDLDFSPIVSGGASVKDHLNQPHSRSGSPMTRRNIENIPIVSGAYIPEKDNEVTQKNKSPKASCSSSWVVDMSGDTETPQHRTGPADKACENLKKEYNQENCDKSRSSLDSDSSEKSSHQFYIDLASLPDPLPSKQEETERNSAEKKNMFSMYIDIGYNSIKGKPTRTTKKTSDPSKPQAQSISKSLKYPLPVELNDKGKQSKVSKSIDLSEKKASFNVTSDTRNTNNIDTTFENIEKLCGVSDISVTEIAKLSQSQVNAKANQLKDKDDLETVNEDIEFKVTNEEIYSADKQRATKATNGVDSCNENYTELFVRLSDLDKPLPKAQLDSIIEDRNCDPRMSRSIPESSWMERQISSRSIDIVSSFHSENTQSLNRLFPHLKNEFSRSTPVSLGDRTRSPMMLTLSVSPGEMEEGISDVSEMSSVQSSICRSGADIAMTDETAQSRSLINSCQSRLGQDLLRMFIEEIAPDVTVEVAGRRLKAHKCILSSRCQYFAGMLGGGWVESAGNVIVMPTFSYNVVHFALCHIYSGVSNIPDSISIVELATLSDMLGLDGLKDAIMFTLKVKYCHNFHRPCAVCIAGVLDCFPLSSVYSLEELYRKCLCWITKYFHKVWPTKAFATLPRELLDKCYQQHVINLCMDNFLETVNGCAITVSALPSSRWSEVVSRMCRKVVNAAAHFAAPRLKDVFTLIITATVDIPQKTAQSVNDCLTAAIEWAPVEETCRSYAYLSQLTKDQHSKPDLISANPGKVRHQFWYIHVSNWCIQCESALVRSAPKTLATQAFKNLPPELKRRLRDLGCIIYGGQSTPSPSHSRTMPSRSRTPLSRTVEIDQVRASFVPYAERPQHGSVDNLRPNRTAKPLNVRMTKAQVERTKFNRFIVQGQEAAKSTTRLNRYGNAKPRYLEPRLVNDKKPTAKAAKKMSSSESSCNTSPIQPRNTRTSRASLRPKLTLPINHGSKSQTMSQDSLVMSPRLHTAEPSTDSLTESQTSNRYGTYTKRKHISADAPPPTSQTQPRNSMPTKIPVMKRGNQPKLSQQRTERKVSESLMSATKSSSAKVVVKPKEAATRKKPPKNDPEPPAVAVMERSGTFLKDEPTFGDKTTIIDGD